MKNKISIIISYILVVVSLALVAGGFIYDDYFSETKIFSRNIMKVVEIKVSDDGENFGHATGCFIARDGFILTNKHVVYNSSTGSNYKNIKVRLADSSDYMNAVVLRVSAEHDLATIKVNYNNGSFYHLTDKLSNGQTIYTIGNPNGFGLSFTSGLVSSTLRNVIYKENSIKAIQTDFVINEGNSGGPVFDKHGNLVGIVSFRIKDKAGEVIQGVSFAIPSSTIYEFLKK